jgi:hypothetical protein
MQLFAVHVLQRTGGTLRVRVTDRVAGGVAAAAGRRLRLPGDTASTRTIPGTDPMARAPADPDAAGGEAAAAAPVLPTPEKPAPLPYPHEWEADVLLADGGVARLRPIRPNDADLLVQFYDRVSP